MRIATPCGSSIHPELARSVARDVGRNLLHRDWDLERGLHVPDNRNRIWNRWRRNSSRSLLMVDSDISFGPRVVSAIHDELSADTPIVFADVPVPSCPSNAWNFLTDGGEGIEPAPWFPVPFDCDLGGTGMIAFHRILLDLLGDEDEPFTRIRVGGYHVTEDTSFAYRMRMLGVRYVCVPAQDLTHHKERPMRPRTT